jgi:hypothetical protein
LFRLRLFRHSAARLCLGFPGTFLCGGSHKKDRDGLS